MRRVMIVGQPGSGKSTLARKIGERTGLPVVHIDKIHWQPGWVERDRREKTRLCHEVERGERWIFEGGHSATWSSRIERADMLIWLDRPIALRLWRIARRTITGLGQTRPDLPPDCPEKLSLLPEFIHFIWSTRRSARDKIVRLTASPPRGCIIVHLRSNREIDEFLSALTQAPSPTHLADG